ncbi:MAG TPA: MFS transporter [Stellaceae bacterium]|jgi:FSR family fosmidomycin resistance protein-like MFS transporter|nr:MFS transporter [Stellaceae bacterium]
MATAEEAIGEEGKTAAALTREGAALAVLGALSFSHLLNDLVASLVPAVYPMLKTSFGLDFAEVGLVTLCYQVTASLLQPAVGLFTDRRPMPYSLPVGMGFTLCGLILLSRASHFFMVLPAVAMVGIGSAVFHPESSRIARAASGGRHGFAQSLFQMGGATGSALGPLLAALIVMPRGQGSIALFALVALLAMLVLTAICRWHSRARSTPRRPSRATKSTAVALSPGRTRLALFVLLLLVFSKYFYLSSLTSYYTFYLIDRFHVSVENAQIHLFVFLGAAALGTFFGGPIGDRYGRKAVIWGSIVGALPFTMMLPYANLLWTGILSAIIGLVLSSAFSAILVYATELVPGRVGTISGLFFGLAFGIAGVGAAVLGEVADLTSIDFVYRVCAWLPLLGLLTAFLPNVEGPRALRQE